MGNHLGGDLGMRFKPLSLFGGLVFVTGLCAIGAVAQSREFIAKDANFAKYDTWTKVGEFKGPNPALGPAHEGNNDTVTRVVFIKNNAKRASNGQFRVGTILAKQHRAADGKIMGITAMVKRGGGFNPEFGGWEWFMLNPETRTVLKNAEGNEVRGAIQMCNGCHSQAKDKDFVFTR
jgi:hypothetical protein